MQLTDNSHIAFATSAVQSDAYKLLKTEWADTILKYWSAELVMKRVGGEVLVLVLVKNIKYFSPLLDY